MLSDVVDHLVCPVCTGDLALTGRGLRCPAGHAFDIARQGYANLLPGDARPGTADTPEMVAARDRFLGAGRFAALTGLIAETLADRTHVLDAGAGTGHYLKAVLDAAPDATGLALDISKHAARRAARAHPRIGAVVADLWRPLPVRSGAMDAILNVFAPRNPAEYRRVLSPGGALYTVTPSPRHFGPLIGELGLISVDGQKTERTDKALAGHFTLDRRHDLETEAPLGHEEIETLVGMGPSAHHVPPDELRRRIAKLPDPFPVPLSFVLSVYR
ncbi:putative RNA methyltransferase [Actinomadura macrotermitis]|uniref:23S rRNA (Guanine(748)-N(1))-methyltransferase n=1 Tax=Actinomadura macrotermitis TaxID=2585200 RepID=A0A7K0BLA7_9ACTN|nr:methyltransferase domain-containing protein [Actinomadura macrotermitis]MQY01977.1 23S rRNA (guanine(748)-N(1))-methyltransferase [Actinomadura macrotermitis]